MNQAVLEDDYQPMQIATAAELDSVFSAVWLANAEHEALSGYLLFTVLNSLLTVG